MFPIVSKRPLNEAGTVLEYVIKAPLVAKKCLPGQFIVLRLDEHGERVPLTIADYDREAGTVTIMVDGTGMCGGCRVTVGGETKFACVDGPEFDGHQVDFAELTSRNGTYREREAEVAKDHVCRMEAMGKALIK